MLEPEIMHGMDHKRIVVISQQQRNIQFHNILKSVNDISKEKSNKTNKMRGENL